MLVKILSTTGSTGARVTSQHPEGYSWSLHERKFGRSLATACTTLQKAVHILCGLNGKLGSDGQGEDSVPKHASQGEAESAGVLRVGRGPRQGCYPSPPAPPAHPCVQPLSGVSQLSCLLMPPFSCRQLLTGFHCPSSGTQIQSGSSSSTGALGLDHFHAS